MSAQCGALRLGYTIAVSARDHLALGMSRYLAVLEFSFFPLCGAGTRKKAPRRDSPRLPRMTAPDSPCRGCAIRSSRTSLSSCPGHAVAARPRNFSRFPGAVCFPLPGARLTICRSHARFPFPAANLEFTSPTMIATIGEGDRRHRNWCHSPIVTLVTILSTWCMGIYGLAPPV
jgi:hypothetical protein